MTTLGASLVRRDDYWRLAFLGVRVRKMRSALSALGIAIGVAAIVAILGLSGASKADLLRQLDKLGTNLLTVQAGSGVGLGTGTLPSTAFAMTRRIGSVSEVSALGAVSADVFRTSHIDQRSTGGVTVRAAQTNLLTTTGATLHRGHFLDAVSERYPQVVLGAAAARHLGLTDTPDGATVRIGGHPFTVIGVLDPVPVLPELDHAVVIGWQTAKDQLAFDGTAASIYVRADPDTINVVRAVLPATVNPAHPEEVEVSRPSDAVEARAAAKSAFTALLLGLGLVALFVGGVGVANVTVVSVLERRSEIGLRRALGATRLHIARQFLGESVLLSTLGGAFGVLLGAAITLGYAQDRHWPLVLPTTGCVAGFTSAVVIGVLAAVFPAYRATRMSPTDALRTS